VYELKYLGCYIVSANTMSLHHLCVKFYKSFNFLYAENSRFDEPVLQHLVNANCKPRLLYGAEVIDWNKSDLNSTVYCWGRAAGYQLPSQVADRGTTFR